MRYPFVLATWLLAFASASAFDQGRELQGDPSVLSPLERVAVENRILTERL